MKQTVGILTALMIALLLVSGFIVISGMEQSELLVRREDELRQMQAERDEIKNQMEKQERELKRNVELIAQLTEERDGLSQQLNDAVLASQEANDAVALWEKHGGEKDQLIQALQQELLRAQDDAATAAMAYEQQAQEDAQAMERLKAEIESLLQPTPAPRPTRFERIIR